MKNLQGNWNIGKKLLVGFGLALASMGSFAHEAAACVTSKEVHLTHKLGLGYTDVIITNISDVDVNVEVKLFDRNGNRVLDFALASDFGFIGNFSGNPFIGPVSLPAKKQGKALFII